MPVAAPGKKKKLKNLSYLTNTWKEDLSIILQKWQLIEFFTYIFAKHYDLVFSVA